MRILSQAQHENDRQERQRLLSQLFDGYNASSDFPAFAFVDDVLDMYPDAKVILNRRRTPQEWVKSVRSSLAFFSTWQYHLLTYWVPFSYWHYYAYVDYKRLAKRRFGVDDIFTVECYERHNQWVRDLAAARGKQVLEWEPDDGWESLCRFLECKVPDEPFPRTNETAEIKKLQFVLVKNGLWAWAGASSVTGVTAAIAVFAYRYWFD